MTFPRSRRRVAAALAAALLAGAGTAWFTRPASSAHSAVSPSGRATTGVATLLPDDPVTPTPPTGSSGTLPPRRPDGRPLLGRLLPSASPLGEGPHPISFSIERLAITMDVKAEGVARDGEMALAPDPADVGWYRYGARPGDRTGATVLAAHVDEPGYGVGPLAQLKNLRDGDRLTVTSGRTVRLYSVKTVTSIKKTTLDLDALFTRSGPPLLHVVTCGGHFDQERRHYDENVVVVAQPVG